MINNNYFRPILLAASRLAYAHLRCPYPTKLSALQPRSQCSL